MSQDGNSDSAIKEILKTYKNVAVTGISPESTRPSYRVTNYIIQNGYNVTGVRPGGIKQVLERPVFEKLSEVKDNLEIVVVFRASEFIPQVVEEVLKTSAKVLWLQLGITHPEAEQKARESGLKVVSDRCFLIEHRRLLNS